VGPIEPEAPSLKGPADILCDIGVKTYLSPHSSKWQSTGQRTRTIEKLQSGRAGRRGMALFVETP
jgi:hypothetical protein